MKSMDNLGEADWDYVQLKMSTSTGTWWGPENAYFALGR